MKQSIKRLLSWKNILYGLYLVVITFLLLEIALRIYNPFHFRVKGNEVILQTNKTFTIFNSEIPVLDKQITHTKNRLGFRGPEKPDSFQQYLSIIAIGGSTTECQYINDGKTWSDRLYKKLQAEHQPLWLNNAGIAGHSTFGNIALLRDYIARLHPKIALFLEGANDIERGDLTDSDKSNMLDYNHDVFTYLSRKSELCNVLLNLVRTRRAISKTLNDRYIDVSKNRNDTLVLSNEFISEALNKQHIYLDSYKKRLQQLIQICRQNNILPVFITQPSLFGNVTDSLTGAHLGVFKLPDGQNGELWWKKMELYNNVLRQLSKEENIHCIDVAMLMPKNSYYFYDIVHFTNEGCQKLSDILYADLNLYLASTFSQYIKQ